MQVLIAHCSDGWLGKRMLDAIEGNAAVTILASSTTMSCATSTSPRISSRDVPTRVFATAIDVIDSRDLQHAVHDRAVRVANVAVGALLQLHRPLHGADEGESRRLVDATAGQAEVVDGRADMDDDYVAAGCHGPLVHRDGETRPDGPDQSGRRRSRGRG